MSSTPRHGGIVFFPLSTELTKRELVFRPQPPKVDACATARVAQPFAVAGPRIDTLALCDLLCIGRELGDG
jgi:hypothetical protein